MEADCARLFRTLDQQATQDGTLRPFAKRTATPLVARRLGQRTHLLVIVGERWKLMDAAKPILEGAGGGEGRTHAHLSCGLSRMEPPLPLGTQFPIPTKLREPAASCAALLLQKRMEKKESSKRVCNFCLLASGDGHLDKAPSGMQGIARVHWGTSCGLAGFVQRPRC